MLSVVIAIVVFILYFNLRRRIEGLEKLIQNRGTQELSAPQVSGPVFNEPIKNLAAQLIRPAPPVTAKAETEPSRFNKFMDWLKEDWLMKSGILLLLFGFGWFTTYAFAHNWIGPMGRITLGIIAGVLFLIIGNWRIKRFLHQGGAFLVLGSTVVLLTVFAAREIYDLFTPLIALAVMFLSTAFVAFASVKYRSRSLALASLILASIAPLLTNSPATDYVGLFSYLFIVILGAIWVTVLTGKREVTAAALVIMVLYSLPHLLLYTRADLGTLLLFIYAFASIFFIANISTLTRLKDRDIYPDIVTAGGNGLLLLTWILKAAQGEWKSLIISAWMIVFVAGSYLIYRLNDKKSAFYTYAGLGVAMLVAATAAELNGPSLTIAYAIESAIVPLVIYYALKDIKIARQAAVLMVGPIWLSVSSFISSSWAHGALNDDFFVLLTMMTVSFILGMVFWQERNVLPEKDPFDTGPTLIKISSIYAYALIWKTLHASMQDGDMATMVSLFIYTLVGIVTYFYGKLEDKNSLKVYGGILLGCVIARLFIVDVWKMELTGKIITFFLLGALLVSTAFIGKNKKEPEFVKNLNP